MRNIEKALQEHKQVVLDAGFAEDQILGIFLYGSQNYGLATENSDVDTKAILIPTLEDLCSKKAGFVKEYKLDNNEKVVVMDLIHYFDNLKKQNINYVETLFTDYKWVNPNHEWIWGTLQTMRESIAYYDVNKAVLSMGHQALHTLRQDSADPKKYAMARYISHFLKVYAVEKEDRVPYKEALRPLYAVEEFLAIKIGNQTYTGLDVACLKRHLERVINRKPLEEEVAQKEYVDKYLMKLLVAAIRNLDNL